MDLKLFQKQLIDKAIEEGFEAAEVYFQGEKRFQVSVFNGEIESYSNNSSNGVSFRGIYNGNMGYAFSERIDATAIQFLIKESKINAEIIEDTEGEELFEGKNSYIKVDGFSSELSKVSAEEKIQAAKNMEKMALEMDGRIKSVDYALIAYSETEIAIQNSKGLNLSHKDNFIKAYISVRAEEKDQVKLGDKLWQGNNWDEFSAKALAREAAKEALSYIGAHSVISGHYKILLRNNAASDLLQTFVNTFFADNIQKGFSLLKDKINQKVASSVITIKDCVVCDEESQTVSNTPFDSEGFATRNKIVVENGVLKTYLHNIKTAKANGLLSTGNGFKESYASPVKISATHFYVVPSSTSLNEMISSLDKGLMITSIEGLHSGANTVSGDFSFAASGYLIEEGKIIRAVEQITVAGNFFEVLNSVEKVAADLQFNAHSSVGSIGSPSLYIKSLAVSGL